MTVLSSMARYYNILPKDNIYHLVLEKMLVSINVLPDMTLEQTAALCNCSVITLNRLLHKIGYPSFLRFKQEIRQCLENYQMLNRPTAYQAIKPGDEIGSYLGLFLQIPDRISIDISRTLLIEIADALHSASNVHVYYDRIHIPSIELLELDLFFTGIPVFAYENIEEMLTDAAETDENSVVLYIFNQYSKTLGREQQLIRELYEKKRCTIIITSNNTAGTELFASYLVRFNATGSAFDFMYINALINLIDIFYRARFIDKTL